MLPVPSLARSLTYLFEPLLKVSFSSSFHWHSHLVLSNPLSRSIYSESRILLAQTARTLPSYPILLKLFVSFVKPIFHLRYIFSECSRLDLRNTSVVFVLARFWAAKLELCNSLIYFSFALIVCIFSSDSNRWKVIWKRSTFPRSSGLLSSITTSTKFSS